MEMLLYLVPVFGILGLLFAAYLAARVGRQDAGNDRMKEIAAAISDGAQAFLTAEYKILPNQLSGGQQQRTAIGRAIVKNPDILLCDEPTGALDYHTSKEILKLIETVNQRYGNTIIMVTHNDAIKDMADRVVKLRDGMIRKNYRNEVKIPAINLEW